MATNLTLNTTGARVPNNDKEVDRGPMNINLVHIIIIVAMILLIAYVIWVCCVCCRVVLFSPPRSKKSNHSLSGATIVRSDRGEEYEMSNLHDLENGLDKKDAMVLEAEIAEQTAEEACDGDPSLHERLRKLSSTGVPATLRKLDTEEWLTVDESYREFHQARDEILSTRKNEALRCLPAGEAPCKELLVEVVDYLIKKYPDVYEREDKWTVRNKSTGEEFRLRHPCSKHPLEVCARLALEDFNIMLKCQFTGQWFLAASASLCPAGWHMKDRIGSSVARSSVQRPIPGWEGIVNTLESEILCGAERSSIFIQVRPPNRNLADILFIQDPKDFFPGNVNNLWPGHIVIRRERQTFRRLSQSGAVAITIKTSITPLLNIPKEDLKDIGEEIRAWPEDEAIHKGRSLWKRAVLGYIEGKPLGVADRDLSSLYTGATTMDLA